MTISIIGAGISGLTLALSLNRYGFDVELYESVNEIKPLGLGLNLQPQAVKIFAHLGLFHELIKNGVSINALEFKCEKKLNIFTQKRGLADNYDYPQIAIHRGKLQQILLDKFIENVGKDKLHLSHRLQAFKQNENVIDLEFVDRVNNKNIIKKTELLIGADGINSEVRNIIHGNNLDYHFEGIMMWRGMTKMKAFKDGQTILVCGNLKVQLVMYPITHPDSNNECYVNWVVEILDPTAKILPKDCWNQPGEIKEFIDYFKDWKFTNPNIVDMFNQADKIFKFPMVDRDPLIYWGVPGVTLIGDAAHPMYPRGANGASQGIVDAIYLTKMLDENDDAFDALKKYELERNRVTSKIVLNNRVTNQVEILSLVEQSCDGRCENKHQCVDEQIIKNITANYKQSTNLNFERL